MANNLSILVLCGGRSTEHQISIQSAVNVVDALDVDQYDVNIVYIDHHGVWFILQREDFLSQTPVKLIESAKAIAVTVQLGAAKPTLVALTGQQHWQIDCVFPILHGTQGEDGCIQGLLQLLNVAYVGADVLSSALCMDKDITKQLLEANGIKTVPWVLLTEENLAEHSYASVSKALGPVLFVKPVSLGSSVGVARVENAAQYALAVQAAFGFDERVMVESCIVGREIECAVLETDKPVASLPAEIMSHHEFYSYDAKYLNPQGATTEVPASLPDSVVQTLQQISVKAFRFLRCAGLLRVDFFVGKDEIFINEVNTIPGFTNISMYPKMWTVSGISYAELLDRLICCAMKRHREQQRLQRVYPHLGEASETMSDQF